MRPPILVAAVAIFARDAGDLVHELLHARALELRVLLQTRRHRHLDVARFEIVLVYLDRRPLPFDSAALTWLAHGRRAAASALRVNREGR
jgi:hypothetical protein